MQNHVNAVMYNGLCSYFVRLNIYYLVHLFNCHFEAIFYIVSLSMRTEKSRRKK
jgi:hypothetical protein